jgi:hypothetical protein
MRPERRRERNRAYYQRHQEARRAEQRALRVKRAEAAGLPTPAQRTWGYWTCPACKEAQPKASFTGRKGTPCDECRTHKAAAVVRLYATAAERQRAYYQEHREERLAYARAYAARRKQQAAQKEAQG